MSYRIGNGYDVHRFAEQESSDDHIMLGGVAIKHSRSLLAHSDGDVLIHALCDALLGSLSLGDIGNHFPDSDPEYKGIASGKLLSKVYGLIKNQNYKLVNADLTLVAQAPKISPHVAAIRKSLSTILDTSEDQISVKATTTEGLGFAGRKEGIACYAVVLVGAE